MKKPESLNTKRAKLYCAPRLRVYGDMSRLTSGGSGATTEGMMMTSTVRRP
jgi:hypothetical protein